MRAPDSASAFAHLSSGGDSRAMSQRHCCSLRVCRAWHTVTCLGTSHVLNALQDRHCMLSTWERGALTAAAVQPATPPAAAAGNVDIQLRTTENGALLSGFAYEVSWPASLPCLHFGWSLRCGQCKACWLCARPVNPDLSCSPPALDSWSFCCKWVPCCTSVLATRKCASRAPLATG